MARVLGTPGPDILFGADGEQFDFLLGFADDDELYGGAGPDFLRGYAGDDLLDGGPDLDRIDYRHAPAGVTVDMAANIVTDDGYGDQDTLVDVERVIGSNFDDTILGSDARDNFTGELGDDIMDGRSGNDFVFYGRAPSAVTIDLVADTATGGEGNDALISIESFTGSNFADTLLGDDGDNFIGDDAPDDDFNPNYDIGGADYIDGRGGFDYLGYDRAQAEVTVDLRDGFGIDSRGNTDTLVSIEGAFGGVFDDVLAGSSVANYFEGRDGADVISGRGGRDLLFGGDGQDEIFGGGGNDRAFGDRGSDDLFGGAGSDIMGGGRGNDLLEGGMGADKLSGGRGTDVLTGGQGNDVFDLAEDFGADTVTDFTDGADRIRVFDAVLADLAISQTGADAEIALGAAVMTLLNVDAADLTAADFIFA